MATIQAINSNYSTKALNFTSGAKNKPNAAQSNPSMATNEPLKPETITIAGKTINKKTAILGGAGILAALTGIALAATFIIKGNGVNGAIKASNAMLQEADELSKSANEMMEEAQKLSEKIKATINEVQNIINKGGLDENGQKIAEITDSEDGLTRVMKYTAQDGTVRESSFASRILNIQETLKNGKKNIIELEDGIVSKYQSGVETLENGTQKAEQVLEFKTGEPSLFAEKVETLENGNKVIAKKVFVPADPRPCILSKYSEGCEYIVDSDLKDSTLYDICKYSPGIKLEKTIDLKKDGKPCYFAKGYNQLNNINNSSLDINYSESLYMDNDKPSTYIKNYNFKDNKTSIAKHLTFKDNKPMQYGQGIEISNGTTKLKKQLEFKDGKWEKVKQEASE